MKSRAFWVFLILALVAACSSIPYQDDIHFLVSAQANSPEFPVYLNGHLCTDMEGSVGLCAKRIKSTDNLEIRFDPQTYGYTAFFQCPSVMNVQPSADVQPNQGFSLILTKDQIAQYPYLSFTCLGDVKPMDRTGAIEAGFEIHVVIYDAQYNGRGKPYMAKDDVGDDVLILDQFARNAWVFDQGKWAPHTKEPVVKIKGDPSLVKAYSSSYAMRFNFLNMGDADGGIPK